MSIFVDVVRDLLRQRAKPSREAQAPDTAIKLYIDLLKRCVTNGIYDDDLDLFAAKRQLDPATGKYAAVEAARADDRKKRIGAIWPSRAHTMIGHPRLDNLQYCVEAVLADKVPGDLIETGVWRGGASIFMRGILKAYGVADRSVWVADSFEGLPPTDRARFPKETELQLHLDSELAVSLEEVQANFARYGLLDGQVRFLKGWFRDTLATAPIARLAVLRLDGDLYESTMDALVGLYDKLSPGGFVIVDDFNTIDSCNAAVEDFRRDRRIATPISLIEVAGAYWRKSAA